MIHRAGPLSAEGVQLCVRCGYVLNDYRHTMVPEGTPPMRGWAEGANIEVNDYGYMRGSSVTQHVPDCDSADAS